jgi:hypothetical protein
MKKLMCILLVGALSLPLAAGERISRSENFTGVKYLVVKEVSGDINVKGASGKNLAPVSVTMKKPVKIMNRFLRKRVTHST